MSKTIPIIDLFAGPGGLGEGFSAYDGEHGRFEIVLSIEKDSSAHKTLELRSFFRKFGKDNVPEAYYDYVCGKGLSKGQLFKNYPYEAEAAQAEAWKAELGSRKFPYKLIDQRIRTALQGNENWVLIGGPPCQAYSLVGRSRMMSNPDFDSDHRHLLYRTYLKIIAEHRPQIFIMENVKGLLTSKKNGSLIFEKIRKDLSNPWGIRASDGYDVFSLTVPATNPAFLDPKDFIIRTEDYGVPQARHRVILMGIRKGSGFSSPSVLQPKNAVHVKDVISDLPRLRSRISKGDDCYKKWKKAQENLIEILKKDKNFDSKFLKKAQQFIKTEIEDFYGANFVSCKQQPNKLSHWFVDERLMGALNHEARSHMDSDLARYLFASCYTFHKGVSPNLNSYPEALLPNHKNAKGKNSVKVFADRFRVQKWDAPATTIVSHISKDGHYYIHPDPVQCRSLTVREAARLQTFPDNYFFEGNRTQQYVQVGNAVPPYLAYQMAGVVAELLSNRVDDLQEGMRAVG